MTGSVAGHDGAVQAIAPFALRGRPGADRTNRVAVDDFSPKTSTPSIRIAIDFCTAHPILSRRDIALGSHQRWKDIGCRTQPNHPERPPNETCRGT
jgi:hypothetical protein